MSSTPTDDPPEHDGPRGCAWPARPALRTTSALRPAAAVRTAHPAAVSPAGVSTLVVLPAGVSPAVVSTAVVSTAVDAVRAAPTYGPPFGYPPGSTPAAAPLSSAARALGWVIAGLGALTFLFAFLPWVTVGELSVSGVGGNSVGGAKDGVITLVLGLVCVAVGGVRGLSRRRGGLQLAMAIVALVMGVLIALTALVDIGDVSDRPSAGFFVVSVGSGLYLTLAAGLALVAVSIAAVIKRR